ncbi:chromate transporter [Verrucomicrobium sp. GAS474]|uniref:chromate transporter n=1 Tax=Verrucomicrobium sp. GAS474 TaxID=1882831 RepID=UPI00087CB14F|nr:chromate transporter [Verrucomicrobium sp. GAS474]SDT90211.1 chromate transporter [Verrucomicrobium sp. GAS474]
MADPVAPAPSSPLASPPAPTCAALFRGFLLLSLMSFGGTLPLAHRVLVEERRWLTGAEFVDLLGLCQFLPGGNIVNLSAAIGFRFRGVRGAAASLLGLLAVPSLIAIGFATVYAHYKDDPRVRHLFAGLAAAAAGLLVSMAVKLARPLRGKPPAIGVALIGLMALAVFRFPLAATLPALIPLGIAAAWWRERKETGKGLPTP